jgi:hypothetical protein
MSETKHTPWVIGSVEQADGSPVSDSAVVYTADGGSIEINDTEAAGDIALLVAAAPGMLDALKSLVAKLERGAYIRDDLKAARSAIATAEAWHGHSRHHPLRRHPVGAGDGREPGC